VRGGGGAVAADARGDRATLEAGGRRPQDRVSSVGRGRGGPRAERAVGAFEAHGQAAEAVETADRAGDDPAAADLFADDGNRQCGKRRSATPAPVRTDREVAAEAVVAVCGEQGERTES